MRMAVSIALQSGNACSCGIAYSLCVGNSCFQCCDLMGFNVIVPGPVIHRVISSVQLLHHRDVERFEGAAVWNVTRLIQTTTPRAFLQPSLFFLGLFQTFLGTTNRCPVGSAHPACFFLECLKSLRQFFFVVHLDFFICRIFQRRVMYFSLIHQYARRRINCWDGLSRRDLRSAICRSNKYSTRDIGPPMVRVGFIQWDADDLARSCVLMSTPSMVI